jgi:hypothetical protein
MFQEIELHEGFLPFVLHLLIGTLGTLLATGVLSAILSLFLGSYVISLMAFGPLFLLPLTSGIALGYVFAKILPSRWAMWVWLVPAVLLVINIIGMLTSSYERGSVWTNEFGPHAQCTACLDEEFLTVPFVGCIAYALGTGLRKRKARPNL